MKAVRQLQIGAKELRNVLGAIEIDRLEIVIPLLERELKPEELPFLGETLDANRYLLKTGSFLQHISFSDLSVPISVLLL